MVEIWGGAGDCFPSLHPVLPPRASPQGVKPFLYHAPPPQSVGWAPDPRLNLKPPTRASFFWILPPASYLARLPTLSWGHSSQGLSSVFLLKNSEACK